MSVTSRHVATDPEGVWAVLADADAYAHWVVGSRDIREVDPGFPAAGTRFHHTLAFGPIDLKDHTEVVESEAPNRLVLHVKGRPFGRGVVELLLTPKDGGTEVEMREAPVSLVARLGHNPLADLVLHGRNVETLRRLAELAEGRARGPVTSHDSGADAGGGEDGPAVGPEA